MGLTRTRRAQVITKVEGGLTSRETSKRLADDAATLNLQGPLDLVLLHFPRAAPFRATALALGSRFCGKNDVSVGTSRARTPATLQYEPRVDILQHGYEYAPLNTVC